ARTDPQDCSSLRCSPWSLGCRLLPPVASLRVVSGNSQGISVILPKHIHRRHISRGCRSLKPASGFGEVPLHSFAMLVHVPEVSHRGRIARCRRLSEPLACPFVILHHAPTLLVENPEVLHRSRVSRGRRLFIPLQGLVVILCHPVAMDVQRANTGHRAPAATRRCLLPKLLRFRVPSVVVRIVALLSQGIGALAAGWPLCPRGDRAHHQGKTGWRNIGAFYRRPPKRTDAYRCRAGPAADPQADGHGTLFAELHFEFDGLLLREQQPHISATASMESRRITIRGCSRLRSSTVSPLSFITPPPRL